MTKKQAISFAETKETEQNDEDIDDFKKTQPDQELNSEKDDSNAQDSKKTWEDLKKAGEFILNIGLYVLPLFDFF